MLRMRSGVQCIIGGDTSDIRVLYEVWHAGIYDRLFHYIRDDSTVLDVGANIGLFAVKAAQHVPKGRVIACEPVPRNIELLKQNILANHLDQRVSVLECAVSGKAGNADLFTHDSDTGGTSLFLHGDPERTRLVPVSALALSDVFTRSKIVQCDFLRMDCEGAEEEILLATPPELFKRVTSLTVQWHSEFSERGVSYLLSFLEKVGYSVEYEETTSVIYAKR